MNNQYVTVFEAMNHARKEILVGVTALPIPEFAGQRMKALPIEVAHWAPTDELSFRRLAENMPIEDAWKFADIYAFGIDGGVWRIILQGPSADERP